MTDEIIFTGQSGATYRFWVSRPLGKPGGFGRVYVGERRDGKPVAVKVVDKQDPRRPLDHSLLRREIDIGRRVAKSGSDMLLPVVDAAETGDALLLVMLRADGTMGDVSLPMSELDVVAAVTDIAIGLRNLHAIQIIHRDLKPGNVLRHNGRWKLADFGIARDQAIGTQDPTFLGAGSHPYMAPEIWDNKSPTVKTDLYALGCLAFELLAGRPPYPGDRDVARENHRNRPIPHVPTANASLSNLITRLMAKNPGGRPQDAKAVVDRLHRVAQPLNTAQDALAHSLARYAQDTGRAAAQGFAAAEAAEARSQNAVQGRAELCEIFSDALDELQPIEPSARLFQNANGNFEHWEGAYSLLRICDLSTPDASLRVYLLEDRLHEVAENHGAIAFGCIFITNRYFDANRRVAATLRFSKQTELDNLSWSGNTSFPTGLNSANIVYEPTGGRLGWQIFRFRWPDDWRDNSRNYHGYGPGWHTHGLDYDQFPWNEREKVTPSKSLARRVISRRRTSYEITSNKEKYSQTMSMQPLTVDTAFGLFQEALDLRPPNS